MSCRTTAAGSAWTTFARLESGLTDVQTLSTFHALRRDGHEIAAPTEAQWAEFVAAQRTELDETEFSEARRRSLLNRLDRAANERPDGPTWYALRNIRTRAEIEASNVTERLNQYATDLGEDLGTVRGRYLAYMNDVDRSRSAQAPQGYSRVTMADRGLPVDHGTWAAMDRLRNEAQTAAFARNAAESGTTPRRVAQVEFPNSRAIARAGYDPHDGRLEVVFRRKDREGNTVGESRTYAYRGVPAHVWTEMCGQDGPGAVYNREIRNHSEYRYDSPEAEEADATRRCGGCGQFYGPGHACPIPAAGEETTRVPVGRERTAAEHAAVGAEVTRILAEDDSAVEAPAETAVEEAAAPEVTTEAPAEAPAEAAPEAEAAAEPQAAPVAQTPARPEARTDRELRIYSHYSYVNRRRTRWGNPAYWDRAAVHPVADVRRAATIQPVVLAISYNGQARSEYDVSQGNTGGLPVGRFQVTGTITYDRPGRGQHVLQARELQCNCAQYRDNGDCPHINYVVENYRQRIVPASRAAGSTSQTADPAAAQAAAEEAMQRDWMRQEAGVAEAKASHLPAEKPEDNYTNNFSAFEADHEEALARKAAGESPVPFMTENATNGVFTRESGRGFGVEIEFDFPSGVNKHAALTAIGRDLHEAGLTRQASQGYYHQGMRNGYTDVQQGGWSYEQDCTVSGEIVSPIMYDEPEAWENLAKVCEIVKRHGGVANAKTGSHVHVGLKGGDTKTASELVRMANQHEDIMYRISQNPDRPKHRPMSWCGPNGEVPQGGYQDMRSVRYVGSGHRNGINLAGVSGSDTDHPEIRYWDGTLDPAVIQTQVKISGALVTAAERNKDKGDPVRGRERVGSHATRLKAVRGNSRRKLTSEELQEDTATFRSFADTLFSRREDKKQVAALFALTKWQAA